MSSECYPMSALPQITRLYSEYLCMEGQPAGAPIRRFYGGDPTSGTWMGRDVSVQHAERLADLLLTQNEAFGGGPAALANVQKLRRGARAVVTGQQVALLGGPLLTLLKAATAVARAQQATRVTGVDHVPVFWLASEDHDLAEVDQISLPGRHEIETLRLGLADHGAEVGGTKLGEGIGTLLETVSGLLGFAPVCELLAECYRPQATLAEAFGRLMAALFADFGLVIIDASGRECHALGAAALRAAIVQAVELEEALLKRTAELENAGFHAQVLVKPGGSLLFLVDGDGRRQVLKRTGHEQWKAGTRLYTTAELLEVLQQEPERISPNALLRPLFQDTLLPVAAYVGGPAEIAYFAQSAVLYERTMPGGRITPVLPRFTATIIEPSIDTVMRRHEVSLDQLFAAGTVDALTQRLGARAMPIEGKRRLASVGNSLDAELTALTNYFDSMDKGLGRSAAVAASKMRYQINRLRRMGAEFEVQKESSLRRHAGAMMLQLLPDGHLQERVLGGIWFLARTEGLIERLVQEANTMCVGHAVVRL